MVSTFLQSTDDAATGRPSLAERLSVLTLAIRLRLTGSPSSPGRAAVHAFALVALLYQALAAVVELAQRAGWVVRSTAEFPATPLGFLVTWGEAVAGLPWIVAFLCLVLGRARAARLLVLVGAATTIGLTATIAVNVSSGAWAVVEPSVGNASRWSWLVVSVLAVLLGPARGRAPRARWWLGGFLLGAVALAAGPLLSAAPVLPWSPDQHWNLTVAMRAGLLAAMVVALARAASRRREPHWLLALAVLGAAFAGVRLARYADSVSSHVAALMPAPSMGFWNWFDVLLAGLALVCAVAGALALRRPSRGVPGPT